MMFMDDTDSDLEISYRRTKSPNTDSRGDFELNGVADHRRKKPEEHPLLSGESESEVEFDRQSFFTVEEAVEKIGFGFFQIKLICICGLFTATDALEMLLLSVLSPVLRCEWLLDEWQVALITTVVFIGMFIGSTVWGSWADKYGRLPILKMAGVWIFYFGILCSFSPSYVWILILRGLVGAGFGGAVQSFTLLSEYLPSKYRAQVLILYSMTWAGGTAFEIFMAYIVIPTLGWRYLVAFSALPTLLTLFGIWSLPESARYLVAAGRKGEAYETLRKAAKQNNTSLPGGQLKDTNKEPRGRIQDLVNKEYISTTLIVWLLWFGVACVYYGIVLAQSEILEFHSVCGAAAPPEEEPMHEKCHCNLLSKSDYWSMIFATLGEFCAIPINIFTIDYLGRRWTILINFLAAGIFFLLVEICTTKIWMTVFIFGVRAFSTGLFNTIYIYTTEVYPTTVRSLGLGSSSAMARIGAMITPFIAQVLLKASVRSALWTYGGLCLFCAIASFFLPIETKGRSMPQTTS